MPKIKVKYQQYKIPEWIDTRDECEHCLTPTNLTVSTARGINYLCSQQCQQNFLLQTGQKNYNQVRDHDSPMKFTTVGKLNDLTAKELERQYRFKHKLTRDNMNRLKEGDTLDRLLGMILKVPKKKETKQVTTKMPYILEVQENNNE